MHSASFDNDASTVATEPLIFGNKKEPKHGTNKLHRIVVTATLIIKIVGIVLSITAILLPSWQIVHLFEYNSVHEHGLWLDCTRNSKDDLTTMRRHLTVSEPLFCVYKWDYDHDLSTASSESDSSPIGEVNRHKLHGWQALTLVLLGFALFISIVSIIVGICSCGYRFLSVVFAACTLLTTSLSTTSQCVFFFYSHRADNRFINGIVGTYEQRVGLAFFLQLASCIVHLVAFLVSLLAAYLSLSTTMVRNVPLGASTAFIPRNIELDRMVYRPTTFMPDIVRSSPQNVKYLSYLKLTDLSSSNVHSGSETCV